MTTLLGSSSEHDPGREFGLYRCLAEEITRLGRIPLLVVDEVGYIPFDPAPANLIFQLVSARYERASMIVTSTKPFSGWGEIFGDEVIAAAMIDRLVHHAEILPLKGDSYRLRDKDVATRPHTALHEPDQLRAFSPAAGPRRLARGASRPGGTPHQVDAFSTGTNG